MRGFPGGATCKEHACQFSFRDSGSIPGLEKSLGGGHSNPLQYSGQENAMDRGVWWATVHGVTKESNMTEQQEWHSKGLISRTIS